MSKYTINPGSGRIHHQEMIQELSHDVGTAYAMLEMDRESQFLRRCVVRAVFTYIESGIECIKHDLRQTLRFEKFEYGHTGKPMEISDALTEKDRETLGSIYGVGRASGKILPLDSNIKRTFKLAAKVWGLKDFKLETDGIDFQEFLAAKNARNMLTHPKNLYDIAVTDHDMHCHSIAFNWVTCEMKRLANERINSLMIQAGDRDAV